MALLTYSPQDLLDAANVFYNEVAILAAKGWGAADCKKYGLYTAQRVTDVPWDIIEQHTCYVDGPITTTFVLGGERRTATITFSNGIPAVI